MEKPTVRKAVSKRYGRAVKPCPVNPRTRPVADKGAFKVTVKKITEPRSKNAGALPTPSTKEIRAAPAIPSAKEGVRVPP